MTPGKGRRSGLIASVVLLLLVLGCVTSPKENAPAPSGEASEAKKDDPLGKMVNGAGNTVVGLGKTAIDGGKFVAQTTGGVISLATKPIGDAAREMIRNATPVAHLERNIFYGPPDGTMQRFDVFWPDSKDPLPMVLYIHGGSFFKKDEEWIREPFCRWLANQGYVVFNVWYRLAPEFKFPTQINDVLGAVIYAKTHAARWNGDPSRVALIGDSAGGCIAAMTALAWDDPYFKPTFTGDGKVTAKPQALVLLYGVYDMVQMYHTFGWFVEDPQKVGIWYLGGTPEEVPEIYRLASPIHRLRPDLCPTLIVCGSTDPLFPQSKELHRRLDEMGVRHGFYVSEGDNHGFTMYPPPLTKGASDCYNLINAFLDLELTRPCVCRPAPSPPTASK